MRLGCSSLCLQGLPLGKALDEIAAAGFDFVDLVAVPTVFTHIDIVEPPVRQAARTRKAVAAAGLEVSSVVAYPWVPTALDKPDELRRRFENAVEVAAECGATTLVVDGGNTSGAAAGRRDVGLTRWQQTVRAAIDVAAAQGIVVAVETPHAGTLAESLDHAIELMAAAPPDLHAAIDTFHLHRAGVDAVAALGHFGDRLAHVALGDWKDEAQAAPGDGDVDFAATFDALGAAGWDGDVAAEFFLVDAEPADRVAAIRRAHEHLRTFV